jgi:hypothetical protein
MQYKRAWRWCGMLAGCLAAAVPALGGTGGPAVPPAEPEIVTVTVTGQSAAPADIARDEALRDAMRNAVEQAAGSFIASQSAVQNYQLIHDLIVSRARGFVKKYEILSEKRDATGVFTVQIKADVLTKAVADGWTETRSILVQKGMPRLMVFISEAVDDQAGEARTVQTQVEKALLKDGFPLIDMNQVKDNDKRDLEAARLADDLNKVAAISGRYKADIIVVGKSRATLTQSRPIYGVLTHLYGGDAEVRAIYSTNAKMLFSDASTASFGDRNRTLAARKVLELAGDEMGKKLKLQLVETWVTELSKQVGADYDLEISNIKFAQLNALSKELRANTKLVTHCETKDYRNDVALLVVGCTTSTMNLATWMSELKSVRLEITQVNPGSIKAKVAAEP